jgi:hypothetical protein
VLSFNNRAIEIGAVVQLDTVGLQRFSGLLLFSKQKSISNGEDTIPIDAEDVLREEEGEELELLIQVVFNTSETFRKTYKKVDLEVIVKRGINTHAVLPAHHDGVMDVLLHFCPGKHDVGAV